MSIVLREQGQSISEIKNLTSLQMKMLNQFATSANRASTQGAFVALSVFFLGIALVLFGLRLTARAAKSIGNYFNLMMWALTLPVLSLVAVYQVGILTGNPIAIYKQDEPFFFISLLLLIPIGIVLFLLVFQKKIIAHLNTSTSQHEKIDR
ncbi:MAG: hypothetical protein ACJ71G_02845 [Nitrososphaeraceae archaeon]